MDYAIILDQAFPIIANFLKPHIIGHNSQILFSILLSSILMFIYFFIMNKLILRNRIINYLVNGGMSLMIGFIFYEFLVSLLFKENLAVLSLEGAGIITLIQKYVSFLGIPLSYALVFNNLLINTVFNIIIFAAVSFVVFKLRTVLVTPLWFINLEKRLENYDDYKYECKMKDEKRKDLFKFIIRDAKNSLKKDISSTKF
ncbi:Uncharacterised protein [Chlamydia trachomatis]|nr:Uncharacterised protein [Chlamydia trachomatis]